MIKIELILEKKSFTEKMKALMVNDDISHLRSSIKITEDNESFHVYIEALDTVAMRASLGAFTRSLILTERAFNEVK